MNMRQMSVYLAAVLISAMGWASGSIAQSVVEDATPQMRLLEKVERSEERGPNTRVWENVYEVDVLDPLTGEPTGEKRIERRRYFEKATNLCYKTVVNGATRWEPAKASFEASTDADVSFKRTDNAARISISRSFNDDYHVSLNVNKSQLRVGMVGVGFYDRSSGRLVPLKEALRVHPNAVREDSLRYTNAFPGCDVEYESGLSEFKQLVKLSGLGVAPDPAMYGFDPAKVYFVVISRLNLHEPGFEVYSEGRPVEDVAEGDWLDLSIRRDGREVCSIAPGFAWEDGKEPPFGERVYKRLIRGKDQTTLLEGVPYSWLIAPDRQFPVTIDYVIKTGNQGGDEVWREGETYWISDTWNIGTSNTLVVEPGAILKMGPKPTSGYVQIGWGNLVARGTKFKHIVATSWKDDTVGEDVDNDPVTEEDAGDPARGDYHNVFAYCNNDFDHPLEYAYIKAAYAEQAIVQGAYTQIHDCIFRECSSGVTVFAYSEYKRHIINNLFADCSVTGIGILSWGGPIIFNVEQCTFDSNARAIWFIQNGAGTSNATLKGKNNLITNITHQLHYATEYAGWLGTYDGSNFTHTAHDDDCVFEAPIGTPAYSVTADPYDTRKANGEYYLNNDQYGGAVCRANGATPSQGALLTGKTVDAPLEIVSNLTSDDTWSKRAAYTGIGDAAMGVHYDRVDYVIGNNSANYHPDLTSQLTINPGVVIAYWRDDVSTVARIDVKSGGKVVFPSSPDSPVVFTSVFATGDAVKYPGMSSYNSPLAFTNLSTPALSSPIQSVLVRYADKGIYIDDYHGGDITVEDAVIDNCLDGVYLNSPAGTHLLLRNGLLAGCTFGIRAGFSNIDGLIQMDYTTIDHCGTGLKVSTESCRVDLLPAHNIVTNCAEYAFQGWASGLGASVDMTGTTNVYWNNQNDVDGVVITTLGANPRVENPKYVQSNRGDYRAGDQEPDGYRLSKVTDDASGKPLKAVGITEISFSLVNPVSDLSVEVHGFDHGIHRELKAYYVLGSGFEPGDGTSSDEILLLLRSSNGDHCEFYNNDSIALELDTGAIIHVRPPVGDFTNTEGPVNIPLWVSVDGSTYWARRSSTDVHFEPSSMDEVCQQDAVYAMQHSRDGNGNLNGLARSANPSGGEDSPAVGIGPMGVSSAGTTSSSNVADDSPPDAGHHANGSMNGASFPPTRTPTPTFTFTPTVTYSPTRTPTLTRTPTAFWDAAPALSAADNIVQYPNPAVQGQALVFLRLEDIVDLDTYSGDGKTFTEYQNVNIQWYKNNTPLPTPQPTLNYAYAPFADLAVLAEPATYKVIIRDESVRAQDAQIERIWPLALITPTPTPVPPTFTPTPTGSRSPDTPLWASFTKERKQGSKNIGVKNMNHAVGVTSGGLLHTKRDPVGL